MLISLLKSIVCLCFIISLWLLPFFRNNVIRHFQLLERYLAKNEKTIALVALTLYICVTIFLQFHHPLDGDETQAWFITRDAPSLSKMYTQMGYEGSPGLWHTILFPLAKAGMPFYVMYFLNHLFAITAVLLWLRFAPFPFVVRLLFPFIHIFLTEYSINARSYALSICLLFTGLTLYKKQYDKWLLWSFVLLLFANTNIPAALLACGFTLFLFFNWIFLKNKTDGKAILLIAAGIILVFIQVYPPKDLAHDLASIKLQTTVS